MLVVRRSQAGRPARTDSHPAVSRRDACTDNLAQERLAIDVLHAGGALPWYRTAMKRAVRWSWLVVLGLWLVGCRETGGRSGTTTAHASVASSETGPVATAATPSAASAAPPASAPSSPSAQAALLASSKESDVVADEQIGKQDKKAVLLAAAQYFALLYSGRFAEARAIALAYDEMRALTTAVSAERWKKNVDEYYAQHRWINKGELTVVGTEIVETLIVRAADDPKLKRDLHKAWVQPNVEKDGAPFLKFTVMAAGDFQHPGYFIKTASGWKHSPMQ